MQESGENYLEAILIIQQKRGSARSIDVANYLNVTKPSVSRAMGILREEEYLIMEPNGSLVLTDKGRQKAASVYERHCCISKFLQTALGVSKETADQDACRIEHIISEETFTKIKAYKNKE